jgi:outer membrane protein assembly factor BamB
MLAVRLLFGGWGISFVSAAAEEAIVESSPTRSREEGRGAFGTNLALPQGNGQLSLLWWARLGEGYSGVSASDGRVFTQLQTRAGQFVVCLDLDSGRELWRTRSNLPWETGGDFPGPYASPRVKSGKVYYADCFGQVGCLDARNGENLWTVNLTEKYKGEGVGFGYACSPLVDDDCVILPAGGRGASVVALAKQDGSVVWKSGDDAASYSSSLSIQVQGHRQIVSFLQHALVANDPRTGQELWRDHWRNAGLDMHNTAPIYQEPYLFYAASFKEGARVLRLSYEHGAANAELVWQSGALCNDIFSSVIVGDYIYGSSVEQIEANPNGDTRSQFECLELPTGRVIWSSATPGHASVLSYDGKLFLLNESGSLIVAEASPTGYRELWRELVVTGKKPCWTTPTIYQGRLFVRNQQTLACYQIGPAPGVADAGDQVVGRGGAPMPGRVSPTIVTAKTKEPSWLRRDRAWLDRHKYSAFWIPSASVMVRWFGYCVGLLGVAAAIAWALQRLAAPWLVFSVLSVLGGIVGLPVLSAVTDKLIFTWPVACHTFFVLLLSASGESPGWGKIIPRVGLALFALGCAGYYLVCREFYLLSGIGFLAGFVAALPATLWFVQALRGKSRRVTALLAFSLSFSIYFWASAFVIGLRMGR